MALHMAGRLAEASACYDRVLEIDPDQFDALHLRGVIHLDFGQADRGAALLERAIMADPSVGAAYSNLGKALNDLGRHGAALAHCDRAIALQPDLAEAHNNRGLALHGLRRLEEALASYQAALTLNPGLAQAYNNAGLALHELNRLDQALGGFDRALRLNAGYAEAWNNRALTLLKLQQFDAALASAGRAIALRPKDARAHNNHGLALQALKRPIEALASYQRAIELDLDAAEPHANRAWPLMALNRPDEALASCDAAITLEPERAQGHCVRGSVLEQLNRPQAAVESFDRALALRPAYAEAELGRALSLLRAGRFEAGWPGYEARHSKRPRAARRLDPARLWLGQTDLRGKRLFVDHEQGFGDTLQFCRYMAALEAGGIEATLSVQTPLLSLIRQIAPPGRVLADTDPPPPFDYHCPLLSLPLALGTTIDSIPAEPGYLRADAQRRGRFEMMLGPRTKPRVGLVWSGNPSHDNDLNRSIALERLEDLLSEDIEWVALQTEVRPRDLGAFERIGRIRFFADALEDFSDTAALAQAMDLIITVDTSAAHLAGALGQPVWILLPFCADWRWLADREDSPWYPSARLFRQRQIGDWAGVLNAVAAELKQQGWA